MKTIKFAAYLFYRYYSTSRHSKDIAYFSTLGAMALLVFIHSFKVMIVTRQIGNLLPFSHSDPRPLKYVKVLLISLSLFAGLALVLKEKELNAMSFSEEKVKRGNIFLMIYLVSTVSLLFIFMVLFAKHQ